MCCNSKEDVVTVDDGTGRLLAALRHSHETLAGVVEPLDGEALRAPSYDPGWPIAQVLSHLGSGSEIFDQFLTAGLAGEEPIGPDRFGPIWEAWNARSPEAQAAECLRADVNLVGHLESVGERERAAFHISAFGMDIDFGRLVQMRLTEHALHSWDVAVAREASATVLPDAVELLLGLLGQLAARAGKPDGTQRRVLVTTTDPERRCVLETTDESVSVSPYEEGSAPATLSLPAEAFVRLVSGRLDEAHTPASVQASGVELEELRRLFPGF